MELGSYPSYKLVAVHENGFGSVRVLFLNNPIQIHDHIGSQDTGSFSMVSGSVKTGKKKKKKKTKIN
jgi:hypothetical protein